MIGSLIAITRLTSHLLEQLAGELRSLNWSSLTSMRFQPIGLTVF